MGDAHAGARPAEPLGAARASHLVRVAATQAALVRVRQLDIDMYRRLFAAERAALVDTDLRQREPLPPPQKINRKARRRTLRRMALAHPIPYAHYRREELASRGIA